MNELEELHLHRVLVAIDGSESAELALRAAVTVARQDHAAITLLVVIPDVFAQITRWPVPGSTDPAALQDQVEREAAELLRTTVERIPDDIPVTTVIRRGHAGREICAQAKEHGDYDGILVGARGLGRVGALLGSVSSYVLHNAGTPVFVARARPDAGATG